MREWTDENTGRLVRQLTHFPKGAAVSYFRYPRHLPGGLIMGFGNDGTGSHLLIIDPESGEVQVSPIQPIGYLKLREKDGTLWYVPSGREIWCVKLPGGRPEQVAEVPADVPGDIADITCDGRTVILRQCTQDMEKYPIPTTKDINAFWRYFSRPRTGQTWAYDIRENSSRKLVEVDGVGMDHQDTSPTDPRLLKFCWNMFDALGQRIWSVRTDGSDLKKIRPQELHEFVTHEFWWPGGEFIGFTYQDRRHDPTLHELPWGEYSPIPTHLEIADLTGKQCYMSGALNCYHSHLYVSPDARFVCGEGTEGHSYAYAARFSWDNPEITMQRMATIHTPYIPFRGQGVETGFSWDSKWLIYNDTIDGQRQICAALMDLEC